MMKYMLPLLTLLIFSWVSIQAVDQVEDDDPEYRKQYVTRNLSILKARIQKVTTLASRAAKACDNAYTAIDNAQPELDSFTTVIKAIARQEVLLGALVNKLQKQAKNNYDWRKTFDKSSQELASSRDKSGKISQELCNMTQTQQQDRDTDLSPQLDSLMAQLKSIQTRANQAHQTILQITQNVNMAWNDFLATQSKVAELNVEIGSGRTTQGRVDLVLKSVELQRGLAGDDLTKVFNLVESSSIFYDSGVYLIKEHPDEFGPTMKDHYDRALEKIKQEGIYHANCLDEVQSHLKTFNKNYNEQKTKLQEIQNRNKRYKGLITTIPGSIQGFKELHKHVQNSMDILNTFKENIDHYIEQAEVCRNKANPPEEDWEGLFDEIIKVLEDIDIEPLLF